MQDEKQKIKKAHIRMDFQFLYISNILNQPHKLLTKDLPFEIKQ